jgi:hypothetical protein
MLSIQNISKTKMKKKVISTNPVSFYLNYMLMLHENAVGGSRLIGFLLVIADSV